nr:hypothetical protein [Nocardia beijingensis]
MRLWDSASSPSGDSLIGHTASVWSVAFSPDSHTLATGSYDGTVRLWDIATRQPIGDPLSGLNGGVQAVAFSPDGRTLASGGTDDAVLLWDVRFTTDVVGYLCDWARGTFTSERWAQYVPAGTTPRRLCP